MELFRGTQDNIAHNEEFRRHKNVIMQMIIIGGGKKWPSTACCLRDFHHVSAKGHIFRRRSYSHSKAIMVIRHLGEGRSLRGPWVCLLS